MTMTLASTTVPAARTLPATRPRARDAATRTGEDTGYKWWVLVTAVFGAFASILDTTIVNTALPKMQAVFGADLHQISYVVTAYTLAQGVVIAASGYLATRYGIKRVYLGSLALFTLGSMLCGLSWDTTSIIIFRVLQGAGGAALFPLSFALVFGAFPERQRGLAVGFFGIPVLFAPALGPLLGGYLAQYVDWRWIFYVNVPVGLAGVLLGRRVLCESPLQRDLPFDWRGFALIGVGLGLLLYGLSNLAYDGWGSLTTVSGPTIAGSLVLLVYAATALRTPQPLLDLRLFARRNFWAGNLIIWLGTISLFGSVFLLPQYLQNLRGLDPYPSGLLLLPFGLLTVVGTVLVGGLYNRLGPRLLIAIGALVLVVNTAQLAHWSTLDSAFAALLPLLLVRGLVVPALVQPANTAALEGITGGDLPGATTLITVARTVVASLAIAVLTNLLQTQGSAHRADLTGRVRLSDPATAALYRQLAALAERHGLAPRAASMAALRQIAGQLARQATALAFQDIYWLVALVTIPAIVLPLLMRHNKNANAERAVALG